MDDKERYEHRNPAHPWPELGAFEYLNIPYDAEFEAWYESDFKNTGWTTPYMKYQGPGNSTNLGAPVSESDFLAKVHDLRYSYAIYQLQKKVITEQQFNERIDYADAKFVYDNPKYTPVGLLGTAGIGAKMIAEMAYSALGGDKHIYPKKNTPMDTESGNHEHIFEVIRQNDPRNTNKVQYNVGASTSSMSGNPYGNSKRTGLPNTSQNWQHGLHITAGNKFRNKENFAELKAAYIKEQHVKLHAEIGDRYWSDFKATHRQYTLHREKPNAQKPADTDPQAQKRPHENPEGIEEGEPSSKVPDIAETVEQPQSSEEMVRKGGENMEVDSAVSGDAPAASANHTSGVGGTGISPQTEQIYIAPGLSVQGNIIEFRNSYRMRSWGNALFPQGQPGAAPTSATVLNPSAIVYPLVAMPVEYLFNYIPPGLYTALCSLPECRPVSIDTKVTPIGQMVAFGTQSELAGSGTTSHTLYGSAVIGLADEVPCDKVTISRNATTPMELSAAVQWTSAQEWTDRLWGTSIPQSAAPLTSTQINGFALSAANNEIITPNTYLRIYNPSGIPLTNTQIPSDASNVQSFWPMSRLMPKFAMQPKTGTPVINHSYSHQGWPIMLPAIAPKLVTTGSKSSSVVITRLGARGRRAVTNIDLTTGSAVLTNQPGEVSTQALKMYHTSDSYFAYCFNSVSPSYDTLGMESHFAGPKVPSVHFGIEAVKANVPEIAIPTYINASCDWYVETTIRFVFAIHHDFHHDGFQVLRQNIRAHLGIGITSSGATPATTNVIYRNGLPLYP